MARYGLSRRGAAAEIGKGHEAEGNALILTPWTIELQEDPRLGYGIREHGGELIAIGMTRQDANAACEAVNKCFPPGSRHCTLQKIARRT